MPKNVFDLRFAVRRSDGFESSIWRAWARSPGDVYLATRRLGGIEKYSFHQSRICRRAFTREHGAAAGMADRLTSRWVRAPTPEPGSGKGIRLACLAFPTDYLSRPITGSRPGNAEPIVWIEAAPSGGATSVEIILTAESEERVRDELASGGRRLILYEPFSAAEACIVTYGHDDWTNRDLRMPGEGKVCDLLFSAADPRDTGRPLRLIMGPTPADGDAALLQELGGYPV
jgi:hypothetical protein